MQRLFSRERIKDSLSSDWTLDASEVEARRVRYGRNDIVEVVTHRWRELAKNTLLDPMIWFLVGTSILFAILGDFTQTIILLVATIPLIGMDAFLHWRTQASTQGLRSRLATDAIIIRNNGQIKVPTLEIVPGDLVVVNSGDYFPADGIIVSGKNLQVDESTLTGESLPITKKFVTQVSRTDVDTISVDYEHWGFAGTRLLTGQAYLRVVYTGKKTIYGEIVESAVQTSQAATPLQKSIAQLTLYLIGFATFICVVLAGVRYYQGFGLVDAILSAATLAVAALPDEFPIVFTFFLGVGVYRLARKNALVRRAVAVENIGRVTCICSDKTGTITEGQLKLIQVVPAAGFEENELLALAAMAARIESGDPLDKAIHDKAMESKLVISEPLVTFPFTEDRKRETAIFQQTPNQYLIASKGAPETIFELCTLTENARSEWMERLHQLAGEGYKVIACARSFITATSIPSSEPTMHYQLAGLLGLTDPPRKEVYAAIKACRESHIHVLMITGDHPETGRAIARQIGLGGENITVMTADETEIDIQNKGPQCLQTIDVISRAIPSQKLHFVQALQAIGEIVAVTGDGVNDVPALKAADIGIAMGGRGTQSAREVAAIVLLDDNFGSIVNAIGEGRQLLTNLKLGFKYLLMLHIPLVFSAAIIPLLGYPLLYNPIHIVWLELIIHPTCMLVFQDTPESKTLAPLNSQVNNHFFHNRDWFRVGGIGLYTTLLVSLSYVLILKAGGSVDYARALALSLLCFTSAALTIGLSGFRTLTSRIVTLTTVITTILLVQIPMLNHLLDLQPLSLTTWAFVMISSLLTIRLTRI